MNVVVVLKGPETHIASPVGDHFIYRSGDVGLATSGSGDILAGVITGLAARSGDPLQSAAWGVFLHGEAGNALAKKSGRVGYLARELLDEIPPILNSLSGASD
jgi:NAD(P)H-hydrate repair Nnr-like enzyme with NAD(P)H-hydrate dehydratase domain